jgi:hypothetical protein
VSDPNSTVYDFVSATVVQATVTELIVIFEKVTTGATRGPLKDVMRRMRLFPASAIYNVPPSLIVIPAGLLNITVGIELFPA